MSVIARFDIMPAVWLPPGKPASIYFAALTAAYLAASDGATIETKVSVFAENLLLNRGIGVTIKGGYNAGYLSNLGNRSVLHGSLTVRSGKLVAERLAVY